MHACAQAVTQHLPAYPDFTKHPSLDDLGSGTVLAQPKALSEACLRNRYKLADYKHE